jgi:hypothetical protein
MTEHPIRAALRIALPGLLLLVAAPASHARDAVPDGSEARKPTIVLRADPTVGFTPVVAVLTGELRGVDRYDPDFCHPAVTWIRIDPGESEETATRTRQDPVCRHAEEQAMATVFFTKQFSLHRPGSYLFRLVIEGKRGRTVRSDLANVRVMRVQ